MGGTVRVRDLRLFGEQSTIFSLQVNEVLHQRTADLDLRTLTFCTFFSLIYTDWSKFLLFWENFEY